MRTEIADVTCLLVPQLHVACTYANLGTFPRGLWSRDWFPRVLCPIINSGFPLCMRAVSARIQPLHATQHRARALAAAAEHIFLHPETQKSRDPCLNSNASPVIVGLRGDSGLGTWYSTHRPTQPT